jgi:hypothetical protein
MHCYASSYTSLLHDYVTIMLVIVIIAITLFCYQSDNRVYFLCEHVLSETNISDGQHTESIMLAKNPGVLINSVGH